MSHRIEVWSPWSASVSLCIGELELPMTSAEDGWWRVDSELDPREEPYAFRVDGAAELPDPRSMRQPAGVHGRSLAVDHSSFPWSDRRFQQVPLSSAVFYEAHVGTFSPAGTFEGAIDKLDHLVALGVTHLELMPVCTFSGARGWGYDGVDLYAPHEAYGGPQGLKRLVDAAHDAGIAITLDVVYNHLGPEGNYLSKFGPYFTAEYHTAWGDAINLDGPESHQVRGFLVDNALMWLRDYHIDTLRLDAIHSFHDRSALHFLEQLATSVDELESHIGRRLYLIAESDLNDPRVVTPRELGGLGIDAQWSDDFHHALHAAISGERLGYYAGFGDLSHIKKALERSFVYNGRFSPERRRVHGRNADTVPQHRFLGFHQNHDQVGNRAVGERLSQITSIERYKVSAALVLLSPFVPLLFQGEEWAASTPFQYFTDHADTGLGRAVSDGRKREFRDFGWSPEDVPDPQEESSFTRSVLQWSEIGADSSEPVHQEVLEWYRALVALRRTYPELAAGVARPVVDADDGAQTLVMRRGQIVVAVNLAEVERSIEIQDAGRAELLLASSDLGETSRRVTLPADTVAVFRLPIQ